MAADVNFVCYSGRLVKDVGIKQAGQSNIVSGTIAVNRSQKKGDEWVDVASFIDWKIWCKLKKQLDYYRNNFTKGSKILINGSTEQESWEKDGQKHSKLVTMATKVELMGASKGGASSDAGFQDSGFPE